MFISTENLLYLLILEGSKGRWLSESTSITSTHAPFLLFLAPKRASSSPVTTLLVSSLYHDDSDYCATLIKTRAWLSHIFYKTTAEQLVINRSTMRSIFYLLSLVISAALAIPVEGKPKLYSDLSLWMKQQVFLFPQQMVDACPGIGTRLPLFRISMATPLRTPTPMKEVRMHSNEYFQRSSSPSKCIQEM